MKKRLPKKKDNSRDAEYEMVVEAYDNLIARGAKEYFENSKPKTDREMHDYLLLTVGPQRFYDIKVMMRKHNVESFTIDDLMETVKRNKAEDAKTKKVLKKITKLENKKKKG